MIELLLVTPFTVFFTWFLITNTNRIKKIEEVGILDTPPNETHSISIIVPMRNEGKNAERCIDSLMNQNYPRYEVIAVDDMSTDNTPTILEHLSNKYPNLRVVTGSSTPQGWVGKTYALWQGFRIAVGEWLLFIDADTYSNPYTLRSAFYYADKHKVDMLSLYPFQELYTFWERVIQPIIFASIASALPHDKVNNPNLKEAFAIGFSLSKGLVNTIILIESSWLIFLNVYVAWESAKTYRIPAYYAISFPISAAFFILIMLFSAFKVISGKGVTWKGRRYVVRTII